MAHVISRDIMSETTEIIDPELGVRSGTGKIIKPWMSTGFFLSVVLSIALSATLLFRLSGFDQARIEAGKAEGLLLNLNSQISDARATNALLSSAAIQLTEKRVQLEASVQNIQDDRDALIAAKQDLATTMGRLDSTKTELDKLSTGIESARGVKNTLESSLLKLDLDVRELQVRYDDLRTKNTNIITLLTRRQSAENSLNILTNSLALETDNLRMVRGSLSIVKDEHDSLTGEIDALKRDIATDKATKKRLSEELLAEKDKLKNLDVVENRIASSEIELAVLNSQLSSGQTELETINEGVTKKTIELNSTSNRLGQVKRDKTKAITEARTAKLALAALESDTADERAELAGIKGGIERLDTEKTVLQRQIKTAQANLKQLNSDNEKAEETNARLAAQIRAVRSDLSDAEDQLSTSRQTRIAIELKTDELNRNHDKTKIDVLKTEARYKRVKKEMDKLEEASQ
jgi:chromosome segregation ATPase